MAGNTKLFTALKECKGKKGEAWRECLVSHGIKRKGKKGHEHHEEHHEQHHEEHHEPHHEMT